MTPSRSKTTKSVPTNPHRARDLSEQERHDLQQAARDKARSLPPMSEELVKLSRSLLRGDPKTS